MRIFLLFAILSGVLAMSDVAVADDKKDPTKDASYDEAVSIRRFVNGKLLTGEARNVPAFRFEKGKDLKFYTKAKEASTPTKGSEITDKDGKVYVVERVVEGFGVGYHLSTVKEKAKPK